MRHSFRFFLFLSSAFLCGAVPGTRAPLQNPPPTPRPAEEEHPQLGMAKMLTQIPRRVTSADGTPGDMVNFLIVGTKGQVQLALKQAGWTLAGRDHAEAAGKIAESVLSQTGYVAMPMSDLFLFGGAQEFGYARANPLQVIAERHHFRLWEAPYRTLDGETVWVGAGTHDIGIEKDRQGKLTHKIDPEVDKERDFIAKTLDDAGMVQGMIYFTPENPVREASTAHGGAYRSDGRILVITLKRNEPAPMPPDR